MPTNQVLNPSFENWVGGTIVADNWTSFTQSGTPVFGRASVNRYDGSYSQYWKRDDTAAFTGGVYQRVPVTPGVNYTITAKMKRQSVFGGTAIAFGYDLSGGTSSTAGTVVYTDVTGTDNTWNSYTANATATGGFITLFARGGHTATTGDVSAYFYVDAVTMQQVP